METELSAPIRLNELGLPAEVPTAPPARSTPRRAERLYLSLCRAIETPIAVVLLLLVYLATNLMRAPSGFDDFLALRVTVKNLLLVLGFSISWRLAAAWVGVYTWDRVRTRRAEASRILTLCSVMSLGALVFPAISQTGAFGYSTVIAFWGLSIPVLLATRAFLRSLADGNVAPVRDVLIVGSGPRAQGVLQQIEAEADHRRVVGFVDTVNGATPESVRRRLLGRLDELEGLLMHRAIDEVLIALPMKSCYSEIQEAITVCQRVGVRARYLADIFDHARNGHPKGPTAAVEVPIAADDYRLLIKRVIDVAGEAAGLIVLSPLFLLVAAAVKLTSPGPVFFAGERYGYNRRRFRMYKFRSMVQNAEQLQPLYEDQNEVAGPIFKIRRDPRTTPVGRVLRRTSIDELPQLFNVLIGDMSLVGPRPMATRDVQQFTEAALMRRFSVRPGITCLWQVSGRNNLGFDDWIALDLRYIDEWSLGLDAKILLRTLPAVIKGTGAS
jgi:exopolysaccharide biosynthesis polyprenyl glycosylphosphotransferase